MRVLVLATDYGHTQKGARAAESSQSLRQQQLHIRRKVYNERLKLTMVVAWLTSASAPSIPPLLSHLSKVKSRLSHQVVLLTL
jgi:hypothetical protein